MAIRKITANQYQKRIFDISSVEQSTDGLLKICFSSETPYPRWFGTEVLEVIGHDDGDMDLTRLNNNAAYLFNHNMDEMIGSVKKAWIENKKGYALVSISSTAEKYATLIKEGHLTKISFGYEIYEMVKIGEQDDIPLIKVKTRPYEISSVTVPADDTVGVIKSLEKQEQKGIEITIEIETEEESEESCDSTENCSKDSCDPVEAMAEDCGIEYSDETITTTVITTETTIEEEKSGCQNTDENKNNEKKFDNDSQIKENININNNNKGKYMNKEIIALGRQLGMTDLAMEFVEAGKSLEEFKSAALEKKMSVASSMDAGTVNEYKKFSLGDFFKEQANGVNGKNTGMAREFTADLSRGRKTNGGFIIPSHILNQRDYSVANHANTSSQDFRGNELIGNLYNSSVVRPLVRNLPTADGHNSVKIPKMNGKNSFYFLAEKARATESKADINDFIEFTPNTIGGRYTLTRDILLQSSLFIDNIAKQELLFAKDEFIDNELLNGDGVTAWYGIFNTPSANVVNFGTGGANGAVFYEKIVDMNSLIASKNNSGALSFITNSKVEGKMKVTQQFPNFGLPILQNGQADGKPVYISNQVADHQMALINGQDFAYIEWGGVEVIVNDKRLGAGMVEVELFLSADFQNLRTEGVVLAKDII